ncbi:MAG TPA: OsmC family protein [Spirochaetia bacterium]|nr:OsmC family protein [Spirochaetia bacterium]
MKSTAKLVEGCFQSIVDNGGHHGIVLDLPGAKGGQDVAPTALELAVMALSGCISTIWAVVAKNSGVAYRKFTVDLEADKPDDQVTITAARATVHIDSDETEDKLERTLEKVMRTCPVGQLYEKAGIHVETTIVKG